MNGDSIKAIIFDLGNVCIDFDHMIAARRISRFTSMASDEIFNFLFESEMCRQFEEGRVTPADFFSGIVTKLNLSIAYDEFLPIWNEIFFLSDKNIEVHRLLKQLKLNYTIAMLSNINVLHFKYLQDNFSVFPVFDNLILSFEHHLRKPDHRIYEKALQILDLKPQEVIYTDDKPEFIKEAELMGIRSFYFHDPIKLKNDFLNTDIYIKDK